MHFPRHRLSALIVLLTVFVAGIMPLPAADDLAWPPITSQTKPWAFWWWMGSAVDKTNLTRELTRYQAAGLGGVHIIPIYGAKGFESKYISYLSPQWMDMLDWSVSEANRLGMGVDMTTGTGWCFGGPQVSAADANASVVVKTYSVVPGQPLNQKFNRASLQALMAFGPDGQSIDLTDAIATNGLVNFSPSNGPWTVYAISQKPSGQKVKRAAPGGEGWMVNLLYPAAVDNFLKPFTAAFEHYTGPKLRAQFQDSYEYRSDWSPTFFAEFAHRRGYRLQTELPALFSSHLDDHAARVWCDYRETVSEIMAQESLPAWTKWAHDHGFITRDQAHGSPGNWLDLYATADIPETEMFHTDRSVLVSKFASSAAHVTGKPLVSAETGTWLAEHFTEKLSDVKYLLDDMFLSGINHVFYHGLCYSPDEAGWPGWHFYAAMEMNPRNSIWRDVPAVNAYAARCQSILQSGRSDDDVLLYWPIEDYWMQPGDTLLPQLTVKAGDWFENQPIGAAAKKLWANGDAFDYVSDAQLQTATVAQGQVHLSGGNYRVVIVPTCQYLPLETFKQLLTLAKKGATVIFENPLPADVSGAHELARNRAEFARLKSALSFHESGPAGNGVKTTTLGRGKVECCDLMRLETPSNEPMVLSGLSFVRRTFDGGWHYFIANRTETNFDAWVSLGRPAKSVAILDPLTGQSGLAATQPGSAGSLAVHLQLPAGASVILRAWAKSGVEGPAWSYRETGGQSIEITGQWKVTFIEGGPTLPADFQTSSLVSWTTFPDTNTQAFAGTAKYETTFDAPLTGDASYCLDLGDMRQSARVRVNGQDNGTFIVPPYRVILDHLKPTGNRLEVEVTSVSANRIRDLDRRHVPWKTFHDINIVDLDYKPFDASHWPLTPCGLLGPVTLTAIVSGQDAR
jgi:alpha-L-rhamnosidase